MITYLESKIYDDERSLIQIACESTDTKPTEKIATGSIAIEADTGNIYMFSEKTSTWNSI